jgi:hypothetical protein
MSRNGNRRPARPQLELTHGPASPEQAAAIAAAIEQFMRDTAPAPPAEGPRARPWTRAALLEGTGTRAAAPSPWGDAVRWGA